MEDIIDIIVTETTNLIEITSQPTDEVIDVNIIDNREDITLNVTPSVVEININQLTGNFGILWGEIEGTLSNQTDLQNALNLKADLVDGKVPSSQLPSYVDDVVEVANYASLPATGEVGKIYITLDTNFIYRWTGSTYVEIKDSSAVWGAITGTLSSQTDLQNALNLKANDNTVVHNTGNETIAGQKTFTGEVISTIQLTSPTIKVQNSGNASLYSLLLTNSSGIRNVYLPDADGTIALTSNLHNPVTLGTANGLSLSTQVLSLGLASSSANGALGSTDWTTFNSKISGSGTSGRYARFTGSGTISDGFIETTGNITYVEGLGLSTLNGLEITGNFGGGSGGLKLKSYDETTGKSYMEFFNTSGNFRLGLEGSTGGGILPGSTAYATVLTTGLTAKNLEFGTNNAKRLTLDGTTGNATFESSVGIGTSSLTGYSLRVSKNITGATTSYGMSIEGIIQSDVTAQGRGYYSNLSTAASTFTLFALTHFHAEQATIGAGSTVTTQTGFLANSTLTGANTNYGFRGLIASGTNRWNLYMDGTANNHLAGSLGIGTTSLTNTNLRVSKNITGSNISLGIYQNGIVQSDVTSFAYGFYNSASTAAASFTNLNYLHFAATQGTIGSGSAITNQYGFSVDNTLTGATNNYGFFGNIASGTNRWNLYMAGTANNHLAGNLLIGSTADNGSKLQVTGAATFSSSVQTTNLFVGTTGTATTLNSIQSPYGILSGLIEANVAGNAYYNSGWKYYGNGPTGVFNIDTSGNFGFYTASSGVGGNNISLGNAKVTFTNAGNVGIGTTSPTSLFHIASTTTLRSRLYTSSGASFMDIENAGNSFYIGVDDSSGSTFGGSAYARTFYGTGAYPMVFWTNATERMRITSGGNVRINTTSDINSRNTQLLVSAGETMQLYGYGNGYGVGLFMCPNSAASGTHDAILFRNPANGGVGSIQTTASLTLYNTTSDYRLKEDFKSFNGLDIINKIKVYDYKWKAEESRMNGVIAHELQEVLGYAVSGVKDGEEMQGVDYSKIVPVMVQAIKDLKAELDTLKNK